MYKVKIQGILSFWEIVRITKIMERLEVPSAIMLPDTLSAMQIKCMSAILTSVLASGEKLDVIDLPNIDGIPLIEQFSEYVH